MITLELKARAREYLAAEAARDARRQTGKDEREEQERVEEARRRLTAAVNESYSLAAEPLMTAAREFLHAEESLERARAFGVNPDQAARQLDRARVDLAAVLEDKDAVAPATAPVDPGQSARRRILVAVDQSQPAEWAVRVAAQYARDLSAAVMLLHVVRPEEGFTEDFVTAQRLDILHRREGRELLDRLQRTLPTSVTSTRMLRTGLPPEEIVTAARDWRADLIVIGTRGRGRVARFLMGSTAEAVIRRAACPVLAVGHEPATGEGSQDTTPVGAGVEHPAETVAAVAVGPTSE